MASSVDVFGYTNVGETFQDEVVILVHYTTAVTIFQAAVYAVTPSPPASNGDKGDDEDKWERLPLAHLFKWLIINPIFVYWAVMGVLDSIFADPVVRITQVTSYQVTFVRMYIALQVVGMGVESSDLDKWQKNPMQQVLMLLHHALSTIAYMIGLYYHRYWFYAVICGTSEMSTIFLNGVLFCKHPHFKDWFEKNLPVYLQISGVGLWGTFIVFRLIQFPASVLMFVYDSYDPAAKDSTQVELVFYPSVVVFLFFLSAYWFQNIHKGMMKVVGIGKHD